MPFFQLPGDGLLLISTDPKLLHLDRTTSQWLGMAADAPLSHPLVAMGCELGEGWLFGRPLPAGLPWNTDCPGARRARSSESSGHCNHHYEACG
jgi:hypothetical protein